MPNVTVMYDRETWHGNIDAVLWLAQDYLPMMIGETLGEDPGKVVVVLIATGIDGPMVINGAELDINVDYGSDKVATQEAREICAHAISVRTASALSRYRGRLPQFSFDVQVRHVPCNGVSGAVRDNQFHESGTW